MLLKPSVILCLLAGCLTAQENQQNLLWELAVVTDDKIELLLSNGSLAGEPFGHFSEFTKLKALTFDTIRHQFIVSDMEQQNDTIFTVKLSKETDIQTIIEDLPDDIEGLAIDPISDILYWTDSINRTINYVRLNDTQFQTKILFAFPDQSPQDITIDVCNRYIYWTNSDINHPTIERAKLDYPPQREILIDSGLHRPAGITIDYSTQRLYWADKKEGIYYSIESTNLEGQERQIVYEGTHCKPFGVSVDSNAIYWTDVNVNTLWMLPKSQKERVPIAIRQFKDQPMGIIAKNAQIQNLPQCEKLLEAITNFAENITEVYEKESDSSLCFNGGYIPDSNSAVCQCRRGYVGDKCEISLCHNYCVHGECYTSSLGFPQCHCLRGFTGSRCERDICDGFCLNGGSCSRRNQLRGLPVCSCREGYTGLRCEMNDDVCDVFCKKKPNDYLVSSNDEVLCKCVDGYSESINTNFTSLPLLERKSEPLLSLDYFQDSAFLALSCLVLILLMTVFILAAYTCSLKKRPRIKKRIIVNKNVTPLTYRPQPTTEQCEITIENCCNMNICETPCFEPPLPCLQSKADDKKKLLANMENGEDLY